MNTACAKHTRPIEILLVEDNPGDVRLTRETLAQARVSTKLSVIGDGEEAMLFLRRDGQHAAAIRPDLILLDLNLPRKDGREVLAEIKADANLCGIPVIVFTTSMDEVDVQRAYDSNVNCYITKPGDLDKFSEVVRAVENFWLEIAKLPGDN